MRSFFLFVICLFSPSLHAANAPFFYKLEKNGVTSHLLGTFHVGISARELSQNALDALTNAEKFLSEADESIAMGGPMYMQPYYPAPIRAALKERGLTSSEIGKVPEAQICAYYMFLEGLRSDKYMDSELETMAVDLKKERIVLDDPAEHRALTRKIQSGCKIADLIKEYPPATAKARYQQELDFYMSGEETHAQFDSAEDREYFSIEKRNGDWAEIIDANAGSTLFINVGYKHLAGPYGLINLLEKKGFKVTKLASAEARGPASVETDLADKFTQNGFTNVSVTLLDRDSLYKLPVSDESAPLLDLTVLLFRQTNWTKAEALGHVAEIARTYNAPNCRILLGKVYLVEADPYKGYTDLDWASIYPAPANARDVQIARQVPAEAPRPVISLMRSSAQGNSAWANPRHRIKPAIAPLLNFTWIMSMVNSDGYRRKLPPGYNPVAHELAHLLGDTGHNDLPESNILHDDFNKINDKILPEQCQAFLRAPFLRRP